MSRDNCLMLLSSFYRKIKMLRAKKETAKCQKNDIIQLTFKTTKGRKPSVMFVFQANSTH